MIKVAYFCEPQVGGTFSFFRRMRPLLLERGIDFRCVPPMTSGCLQDTTWASMDGLDAVEFPEADYPSASRILIEHLTQNEYAAVMVLPGTDILSTNLVRYLPRSIGAVARVPMITRGAYAPTRAIMPYLDAICAVSHRVRDDLVGRYAVPDKQIEVIYNGADGPVDNVQRRIERQGGPFWIFYSGRLWDIDKGVLLLPDILNRVRQKGVDARLMIAGAGPDRERMQREFERRGVQGHVEWLGDISLEKISDRLTTIDCFVLPSRFEGCPNALLEAMAHGCPCVASRIRGSVDVIIEDGRSGLLANVADPESFAIKIVSLAENATLCAAMGDAAKQRVATSFSAAQTADRYAHVLRNAASASAAGRAEPRSLDQYEIPRAMQPTWRTRIPVPIKNVARKWMERFGISS